MRWLLQISRSNLLRLISIYMASRNNQKRLWNSNSVKHERQRKQRRLSSKSLRSVPHCWRYSNKERRHSRYPRICRNRWQTKLKTRIINTSSYSVTRLDYSMLSSMERLRRSSWRCWAAYLISTTWSLRFSSLSIFLSINSSRAVAAEVGMKKCWSLSEPSTSTWLWLDRSLCNNLR